METKHHTLALSPLLKWPGGKRWFVRQYYQYLEQISFKRLVEPFSGALALSLALRPKHALVNDLNQYVIHLYEQIQNTEFSLNSDFCTKEQYYLYRQEFNELIEQEKPLNSRQAQLFWLLNRWGFNGLCRFNKKGLYNVPYGSHKKARDVILKPYQDLFQNWQFTSKDFQQCVLEDNDFVFCDPPYDDSFKDYCAQSFSFDDQIRLVNWLRSHQGPVLLMNHPTERILELYQDYGYKIVLIPAPRSISCTTQGRKKRLEVLAMKNISWKIEGKEIQ